MIKQLLKEISREFSKQHNIDCVTYHYKKEECSCCCSPDCDILIPLNGAKNKFNRGVCIKGNKIIQKIDISFKHKYKQEIFLLKNILNKNGFKTTWDGTANSKLFITGYNAK
jgi:hypothetical protein